MDSKKKELAALAAVCIFFTILYSLISFGRHHSFRSTAYDLGIFNQAIYQYSRLEFQENTVRQVPNLWGDHLEITFMVFAPLYWIFGSYTLLVVQILAIIAGGVGIYVYAKKNSENLFVPFSALLLFFTSFGVIAALAFDYHNNVLGIMFLPWLLVSLKNKKKYLYWILLALFLFSKETMGIIGIFLGLSLATQKEHRRLGLLTSFLSVLYFFLAIKIIIPFFSHSGRYEHWFYGDLGKNVNEAIIYTLKHPLNTLKIVFNTPQKILNQAAFLLTGGLLSLISSRGFLLLLPLFGQKFLTTYASCWGNMFHYSIEMSVVSGLFITDSLKKLRPLFQKQILLFFIFSSLVVTSSMRFNDRFQIGNLLRANYYHRKSLPDLFLAIEKIKPGQSVSAMENLVPHLANRNQIYVYPITKDSKYILLDAYAPSIAPFDKQIDLAKSYDELVASRKYSVIYEHNGIYLFEKL